jgi:hypothetical protein
MDLKLPFITLLAALSMGGSSLYAQFVPLPVDNPNLRPIHGTIPSTSGTMIPINPASQAGLYPSNGVGSPTFDPYSSTGGASGGFNSFFPPNAGFGGSQPPPMGAFPGYTGPNPMYPGVGPSGTVGSFPTFDPNFGQPGALPNSAPSALFPSNSFGGPGADPRGFGGSYGPPVLPPPSPWGPQYGWNPPGSVFDGGYGQPQFVRFCQGPRFRHAWLSGNNDADSLMIHDSDFSIAFAIPNFGFSNQPLYLMPSFSLHQWHGPRPPSTADLPALAYSAFLDSGWQSDPARILGAELGLRVGVFSDFDTTNSDSLRVMGRGIGRIRLTPQLTFKLGAIYLDRVKVKILPAGGLLWQPNPGARFDLFFPEPKLAQYLSTVGTSDLWWYVGGYYGGGSWTVTRANNREDEIDINDIRLVLGVEWGRNEMLRDGRRVGFFEVGYVFDRELIFRHSPADNLSLQDTFMLRAGIGY